MSLTTSKRFDLLQTYSLIQDIYVGSSPLFTEILRNMRLLFSEIYQPDADEIQNQTALLLRFEMQKWLISPSIPDIDLFERCGLDSLSIGYKWGKRAEETVNNLKSLFVKYTDKNSVLNNEFILRFEELYSEYPEDKIKIWCHKKDRSLFIDLLKKEIDLDDKFFISTLAEYRRAKEFDVLIRFGPFRSTGIANTPFALITSPSYKRLVRFIWEGMSDEEGFAADPILTSHNYFEIFQTNRTIVVDSKVTTIHAVLNSEIEDLLVPLHKSRELDKTLQKCVLVEFPNEYAVLMRPGTNLLVFNPQLPNDEAIGYRCAADIDSDYYLIHYDSNVDLGEVIIDASKAPLAAIWKQALADFWYKSPQMCINAIKRAGIDIQDVERALNSWSAMNGSVIRAPRSKKNFEALITKVLEPSLITAINERGTLIPGWRRAWREIELSRVQAIQHGTVEHAIVNEQLVMELSNSITVLRDNIVGHDIYSHRLQPACGLEGMVIIKPIIGVKPDVYAPIEKLGKIVKLPIIEQFCVERSSISNANGPKVY